MQAFGLARFQRQLNLMRADWLPTVSDAVCRLTTFYDIGTAIVIQPAKEGIPACVKTGDFLTAPETNKMIPAFTILGLVKYRASLDFHFRDVPVSLKICGVIEGVVETEFGVTEQINFL